MNSADHDTSAAMANADNGTSGMVFVLARLAKAMSHIEQFLAAVALIVVVCTMGSQVIARYAFGTPFSWSEEVARLALIWMTFMAAAFVMQEKRHITVDVISVRLSLRGQLWMECLSHMIVAGACLRLMFGGLRFVWYVGKVGSPSMGIPMSFWYGAVEIGLLLMAGHSIVNLLLVVATGQPTVPGGLVEEDTLQLEMEPSE